MTMMIVTITFKSGKTVDVQVDEAGYEKLCSGEQYTPFQPAPGYAKVYIRQENIDAMMVTDTWEEEDNAEQTEEATTPNQD